MISIINNFFYKLIVIPKLGKRFVTPKKFKTPERERFFRKSAKKETILIDKINKSITIYHYGFAKDKVLLIHGWSGRGTQFYKIADRILENKMMVVFFDAPAHGISKGEQTNLNEYIECVNHIYKKFGPFQFGIGHSLGAMALLQTESAKNKFQKIISISATTDSDKIIKQVFKNQKLNNEFLPNFIMHLAKKYKINVHAFNGIESSKKINIPVLFIHDSKDSISNVKNAIELRLNNKQGELLITNNLGHSRLLINDTVINRIINFITEE